MGFPYFDMDLVLDFLILNGTFLGLEIGFPAFEMEKAISE